MAPPPAAHRRLLPLLWVFACLIAPAAPQAASPLERWLQSLTLRLPDLSYTAAGLEFNVSAFECTAFRLAHLQPSHHRPFLSLAVRVEGIHATCRAQWTARQRTLRLGGAGTVTAVLSGGSAAGNVSLAAAGRPPLPAAAALTACDLRVPLTSVRFEGSEQRLLNLLEPVFIKLVDKVLPGKACGEAVAAVAAAGGPALGRLAAYIRTLHNSTAVPADPWLEGMVHWQESHTLRRVQGVLDVLLGPLGLFNRAVERLTGGTGIVVLPEVNWTSPLLGPVLNGTYLRLGVAALQVAGLDQLAPVGHTALQPWGNQSLRSLLRFRRFGVHIAGSIAVHPRSPAVHGIDLVERFNLSLAFADLALQAIARVALNQSYVAALDDLQLIHPSCVAPALAPDGVALLAATAGLAAGNVTLRAVDGELEAEVDAVLSAAAAVALDAYGAVLPAMVGDVVRRGALPWLNNWTAAALSAVNASRCPATPADDLPADLPRLPDSPISQWLQELTVSLPPVSYTAANLFLNASGIVCRGMGVEEGQAWRAAGAASQSVSIALAGLALRCQGHLSYRVGPAATAPTAEEDAVVIDLTLNHTAILLGLDLQLTGSPPVPTAARLSQCGLRLNATRLHFTGGLAAWVANLIAPTLQRLLSRDGGPLLCQAVLPPAMSRAVTAALRSLNAAVVPRSRLPGPTPQPEPPARQPLVAWGEVAALAEVRRVLRAVVGQLDQLVAWATGGSGLVTISGLPALPISSVVPGIGTAKLVVTGVAVGGLDTFRQVDVLEAVGQHSLRFRLAADRLTFRIELAVTLHPEHGVVSGPDLQEDITISLGLHLRELEARLFLPVTQEAFRRLSGGQFVSPACLLPLLSPEDSVALTYLALDFDDPQFNLTAGHGAAPGLEGLLATAVETFVNAYAGLLPGLVNGSLPAVLPAANTYLPLLLRIAQSRAGPCPADELKQHTDEADRNRRAGLIAIGVFTGVASLALLAAALHNWRWYCAGTSPSPRTPMLFHTALPWPLRYGLALAICLNLLYLVSSNTHPGAIVGMEVTAAGAVHRLPQGLFEFALGNTVDQLWHAGVYPLAILIAVFSGMWPYIKLCLLLGVLATPVSWAGSGRKELLLVWLDRLGKWSLIDAYVLVLFVVAFRFHAEFGAPGDGPVALDVIVTPEYGFTSFLLATQLSLLLSHIMLAAHRYVTRCKRLNVFGRHTPVPTAGEAEGEEGDAVDRPEALCGHRFRLPGATVSLAPLRVPVAAALVAAAGTLCVGAFLKTFQFHFRGLAGWVLGDRANTAYSLVSPVFGLRGNTESASAVSIAWIQVTYLGFAFVVPLAQLGVFFVLWWVPLRLAAQCRWFVLAEVLTAWSAVDVFVVSVVAALLQIRQFAQFIVGNRCDAVNAILAKHFPGELHGDPVCFDVVATVEPASAVLFAAAALIFLATGLVMGLGGWALQQRCAALEAAETPAPRSPTKLRAIWWLARLGLVEVEGAAAEWLLSGAASDSDTDSDSASSATSARGP